MMFFREGLAMEFFGDRFTRWLGSPSGEAWLSAREAEERERCYSERAALCAERDRLRAAGDTHGAEGVNRKLYVSANPRLAEFQREMRDLEQRFRSSYLNDRRREERTLERYLDGSAKTRIRTNEHALDRRIELCRAAIAEAEAMKTEANLDIEADLQPLRAGIEAVNILELKELEPSR